MTGDSVLIGVASIANDPRQRTADRLKAFEMLGRYLSLWSERPELQQVVINMDMGGSTQVVTVDAPQADPPQLPAASDAVPQ